MAAQHLEITAAGCEALTEVKNRADDLAAQKPLPNALQSELDQLRYELQTQQQAGPTAGGGSGGADEDKVLHRALLQTAMDAPRPEPIEVSPSESEPVGGPTTPPQWAVEEVLLSSDLVPLLLAPLQLNDGAAAAVCSQWLDGWKATSEGRPKNSLEGKLAYFNLTTHNVRLSNNGKVIGVHDNRRGKYDARGVVQLANTGSGGRTWLNVYISLFNNADDATVAVTLFRKQLETDVTTDDGMMTHCEYLNTLITDNNRLREEKQVLRKMIMRKMRQLFERLEQ